MHFWHVACFLKGKRPVSVQQEVKMSLEAKTLKYSQLNAKTLESDSYDYDSHESQDVYEEYGFEGADDYQTDEFLATEDSWEGDGAGEESQILTAVDLRTYCGQLEAQLKNDSSLGSDARKHLLKQLEGIRATVNYAQSKGKGSDDPARQEAFHAIQADIVAFEASLSNLPAISQFGEEIETAIGEIEAADLGGASDGKKTEWVETLKKAQHELELNPSEAGFEAAQKALDAVQEEFEEIKSTSEEQAAQLGAPIRNLVEYLGSKGENVSEASIKEAMGAVGLSEKDLQNITLPTDAATHAKLFQVLQKVDSRFAALLQTHAANPFDKEVLARLSEGLSTFLSNAAVTEETAGKVLGDCVTVPVPSNSDISSHTTGDYADHADEMWNHPSQGLKDAIATGDWEDFLGKWIKVWDGMDWNKGHAGSTLRNLMGAIYASLGYSEAAFANFLKKNIPQWVLREFSTILEMSGQHEKLAGDVLDRTTLIAYFQKAAGNETASTVAPVKSDPPPAA